MVYRQMFEERETVIGYSASHDQHCPGPAEEERRRGGGLKIIIVLGCGERGESWEQVCESFQMDELTD